MKIVIQTNADFTPKGKRRVQMVKTTRGYVIRGYVGGKRYCTFPNAAIAIAWRDAQ